MRLTLSPPSATAGPSFLPMKTPRVFSSLFLLLACLCGAVAAIAAENASPRPIDVEWRDEARQRNLPVTVYLPATDKPCPVIVFSHGLGGSRHGYAYLGEYWAAHGYVCVHLQHPGSDEAVWKNSLRPMKALRQAAVDPANARNRPADVKFALDRLTSLNQDPASPLHGRLDLAHVGLAGHSFGAYTTMACVTPGHPVGGHDPRIKAAIAMSTPKPRRESAYTAVNIPVYHLTGTADTDMAGGAEDPKDRRIPYDQTGHAPALLLTLNGGDHMVFSGPGARRKPDARDLRFQDEILRSTLAFWDAELKSDATARQWLLGTGFAALLGADGTLEQKGWAPGAR